MDNIIYFTDAFTDKPGYRYRVDGRFSGQEFFEDILLPKYLDIMNSDKELSIDLTGIEDMSEGFIDESFGKLSRMYTDAFVRVNVHSRDDPGFDIATYITDIMMNSIPE